MRATSTPGIKPALGGYIPPQIDMILEAEDRIELEYIDGKLYIHVNGVTVLRVGSINPDQINIVGDMIV